MKPYTLTDRAGESISPMTSTRTVFDERGVDLDTLLALQRQESVNALKEYAGKTELAQGLAGKQDKLSTTEDLHITSDSIIGLTEAAKMRLFIDLWNEACGKWGKYDPDNAPDPEHPFYLNELWLTYDEAVGIYNAPVLTSASAPGLYRYYKLKTNLPPKISGNFSNLMGNRTAYDLQRLFMTYNSDLEVLNLSTDDGITIADMQSGEYVIGVGGSVALSRSRLRKIIGTLGIQLVEKSTKLFFAPHLEEISLAGLFHDCDLSGLPKINIASLRYLVANKYATHPSTPTVTVAPEVYARLTDETNEEWHAVLEAAAEKNITFATV